MTGRGFPVPIVVAVLLLASCTGEGEDPEPQASPAPTASATASPADARTIPGITGQMITDVLTATGGYDCDGPEQSGTGVTWDCLRFGGGARYDIRIHGEAEDRIDAVSGRVRVSEKANLNELAIPLVALIGTTPYTGAERNKVQLWAQEHIGQADADLEVAGVRFHLRTRGKTMSFSMVAADRDRSR